MAAIAAGETQDFVKPLTDPDLDTCRVLKGWDDILIRLNWERPPTRNQGCSDAIANIATQPRANAGLSVEFAMGTDSKKQ